MRNIHDEIPKVSGATQFSFLDARIGFRQAELDKESSKRFTIITWGKYGGKRHPFGLTTVGMFQEKMDMVFGKLDELRKIAVDTFVNGNSEAEQDQYTIIVLDTVRDNHVRFNPDKFQFKVDGAFVFVFTLTRDDLRPETSKQ